MSTKKDFIKYFNKLKIIIKRWLVKKSVTRDEKQETAIVTEENEELGDEFWGLYNHVCKAMLVEK